MARSRIGFWQRATVAIIKPPLMLLTRRSWQGAANLPAEGGVILAVNHISHFDPLVVAHFVYDAGRWPQFLGKQAVFDIPVVGRILRRLRQIPVRRGTVDAAKSLAEATAAVQAGDAVVIYPEGTHTRHPELWPMRGRTGVARLWLATGAPVVPIVTWGPERLFDPRTRKFRLRPRTPVTVVAGEPLDLAAYHRSGDKASSADLHQLADTVMLRLRDLLAEVRGESAPPLWAPVERRDGPR